MSRRHAELRSEAGRFVLKDLGSMNGTHVNSRRVGTAELADGDEIWIGRFKFAFFAG